MDAGQKFLPWVENRLEEPEMLWGNLHTPSNQIFIFFKKSVHILFIRKKCVTTMFSTVILSCIYTVKISGRWLIDHLPDIFTVYTQDELF